MDEPLAPGVYETLHSQRVSEAIGRSQLEPEYTRIQRDDEPRILARHIASAVERHLTAVRDSEARLVAANTILSSLQDADEDNLVSPDLLTALHEAGHESPRRPATPLSDVALLTNTRDEPNMASEIARELASADRVDLLCAFIRFAGIAVISRELERLRDRGVHLRVVTTTYRGATERRAIDDLVNKYGADVRIRYETASTRLHAKAWLFRRNSGFDTGYVGSSNLSRSAMVDGLEWNVRISNVTTPALTRKFEATFDTYWDDTAFKRYDPNTDADLLDRALAEAGGSGSARETITVSGLEVRPYPHQERILEALDVARVVHDRRRNLIVAATGTGKTVVAALDYKYLCAKANKKLRLLFVAHRKEILEQSLRKYREVLGDGDFGELYVDGRRPSEWLHVFASVQSLAGRDGVENVHPEDFDVVVIDEFHHAAATTYRALLDRVSPSQELLGLTATPERSDGADILGWFGGRSTYELRLWDALEQDLLCPFHYYGVADNTDLRNITWSRGDYRISDLENIYTGNDARTRLVLNAIRDRVADPHRMRALGFCVSIAHANYVAQAFNMQGIAAAAIDANTASAARAQAFADLRNGTVQCLFAVDIFNEGIDIPDVDTLLMLRPTQSATVFLQQLGRGLRRSSDKAVLTVLDFIGHHRIEFNFAPIFSALTGERGKVLINEIEGGFPFLPGGSRLILDRQSQEIVIESIRGQLPSNRRKALVADVRAVGQPILAAYLAQTRGELSDIYAGSGTRAWTPVVRDAGLPVPEPGPDEEPLLKRIRSLAHVDDLERIAAYHLFVTPDCPSYDELTVRQQAYARMLFFTLWSDLGGFDTYDAGLGKLREHPAVCSEISQLFDVATDNIGHVPIAIDELPADCPLFSHAHYRREEVLAAIGFANMERKARGQAGGSLASGDIEALFINLHKDAGQFSPTTMYRDYPISRELFQWESPNNTAADSDRGRRYIDQLTNGVDVLLFVRDRPDGLYGSEPFIFLGPADYVEHRGERPIALTWKLRRPMPADVFASGSVIAS
ncbi:MULTISPECIES: DUF3427 domain-containing protein [unclassified Mycolicibacterium]|uniref:DUF3427 domain-containing protein n=1 Tax=unclassified Mycolicibacterium TaxID=2636767 RepID=UPI00130C248A|nr:MULTISPECIES: DUF3427 domain-containing protein [unclassified Mycolicibacterium]MUL81556.1 DUF3427 domain-containing protein [Mycolicibacterium sp. CBMA 329]MUL87322.1 DUF3427 domain-containing protein [Mycolicibacterium sp. CBMA 331]MUM02609.1 DUF3427 domain-containing protein [Mycolicibacterium sp. CBMA 334]MUM37619.1 DUF3427 domain-containing protein [Mycolicibacterium sp. CBMA 247]MUM43387.1 DUF3427 domain-containing protein [Mycolicibacterium sp. CBMA 294]